MDCARNENLLESNESKNAEKLLIDKGAVVHRKFTEEQNIASIIPASGELLSLGEFRPQSTEAVCGSTPSLSGGGGENILL